MKTFVALFLAIVSVAFGQSESGFSVPTPPTIRKIFTPWTGQYVVSSTFVITITAIGDDYTFMLDSLTFGLYRDGVEMTSPGVSFSVGYQVPSSGVITTGLQPGQLFRLSENNQINLNVTPTFTGPTANPQFLSPAVYSIGLESVSLIEGTSSTRTIIDSMAGLEAWRSAGIQLNPGDINVIVIPEPWVSEVAAGLLVFVLCLVVRRKRVQPAVFSAC